MMNTWIEKEVSISEIQHLLHQNEIEIESPDGWVGVNYFIDKGVWDEYVLILEDDRIVKCNENHLFETSLGWSKASDLALEDEHHFLTSSGYVKGRVRKTDLKIPIVDINVNHPNHRYYTNGVSSHNTGVGKTMLMTHCAASNLAKGYNVLYITMEMAEEEIAKRIDANLLDIPLDDLMLIPKESYDKKVARLRSKTNGTLIIKEYPTASAGSANFRYLINELKIKKNFVPSVIYVDYLNICMSSRLKFGSNVNTYNYIKSIAEELRGLAVEFNVPIFSATQTTRSGYTSSDIGLEDTSESFGLPATADLMLALISTEELEELNQIMVKQLKNRHNNVSAIKRFVIGIDRSKMKLYDVEQDAQEDLIDKPMMDRTDFGQKDFERKLGKPKFNKDLFKDFT